MKVILYSYGKRYAELQGPAFEVDTWLADPVSLPDKPGTDPEINEALLNDPGMQKGLEKAKALISAELEKLSGVSALVKAFKLYFRCAGGFQRSVVAAEAIAAWLRNDGYEVEVVHLTMDLALKLKTGSYLEEEKKLRLDLMKKYKEIGLGIKGQLLIGDITQHSDVIEVEPLGGCSKPAE